MSGHLRPRIQVVGNGPAWLSLRSFAHKKVDVRRSRFAAVEHVSLVDREALRCWHRFGAALPAARCTSDRQSGGGVAA
jgi:hypothetical protein